MHPDREDKGTPPAPVIRLEQLSKRYGRIPALAKLDLAVYPGELFGFLGPNGAGKTTAIRVITGFIKATSGRARVFGLDAWRDSVAIKRRLGFIPDFPALYDGMTGAEFLDYLARLHGRSGGERRAQLCDVLELSQADLHRRVKGYSRGMRQKLAIIQALQHQPDLLVLDEPTEGLDPLMQQVLFRLLREFQAEGGTVFMSSHILPEVEQLCQRVAIIRAGELVAVEEVQTLRRREVRSLEVEFRGAPPLTVEAPGAQVVSRDGRRWRLAVRGDINPVLRELSRYDLADLVLEPAHLEDVFLDYYREGSAS